MLDDNICKSALCELSFLERFRLMRKYLRWNKAGKLAKAEKTNV